MFLTFTDSNAPETPADALRHNTEDTEESPQKINMTLNMEGMVIIFNDDSIKLATLVISAGEFKTVLLPESMRVSLKLNGFDLTDESNTGFADDSVFRKLITMKGKNLTELNYETFDATTNVNQYDSLLTFTTGPMHVNFNEASFNKLIRYFFKFQQMKSLFDKAREIAYNQAPSIETVNNMKMDIVINAPIIQFPRLTDSQSNSIDILKVGLGEIFVQNHFTIGDESEKINNIRLGIRTGQALSLIHI